MKLKFDEITSVPRAFHCENTGWHQWSKTIEDGKIEAQCTVSLVNKETVEFAGDLLGSYTAFCDRCGCKVMYQINESFSYKVTTKEEIISDLPEAECDLDDLMTVYAEEPVVDVEELLGEQADLAIPMMVLCDEDCQGLCSGCGAKLNEEECQCDPGESSSPFAVLKKLSQ